MARLALVLQVTAISVLLVIIAALLAAPAHSSGDPAPVQPAVAASPSRAASADSTVSLARPARSMPAPSRRGEIGTALIGGRATWYDDGPGFYGAAGPALRHALGKGWRGSLVRVDGARGSVVVTLVDWCACGTRHGQPTLVDLSPDAFRALAPLSAGVVAVSVELHARRVPDPPATDTE